MLCCKTPWLHLILILLFAAFTCMTKAPIRAKVIYEICLTFLSQFLFHVFVCTNTILYSYTVYVQWYKNSEILLFFFFCYGYFLFFGKRFVSFLTVLCHCCLATKISCATAWKIHNFIFYLMSNAPGASRKVECSMLNRTIHLTVYSLVIFDVTYFLVTTFNFCIRKHSV